MIGQLILAIVLIVGGAALWARGSDADRLADAQRALVTLQYRQAADAGSTSAAAQYWTGNYGAVNRDADPFLAANAAYRTAMAHGGDPRSVVTRLDDIAKRYADVLRDDPANEDAAYNYEFVLRLRRAAMQAKQTIPGLDPAARGITVHGLPGAPPKDSDAKKFKMIVPMMPDERQEAEEAGRSGRKIRKG